MAYIQTIRQTLLNGVTATTTSSSFPIDNAGRVSLQLRAAGISSGNGVFTVEVSNDGSNWVAYNRLTTNVTNTNAQTDVRVASVTINTNSGSMIFFPPGDTFNFLRVVCTVSTDGSYFATAFAD